MTFSVAEKLLQALDPVTGALLYTFHRGTKLSMPLTAKSVAYPIPGALRKFDPRGDLAAPIDTDDVTWEFNYKYSGDTWTTVHRALVSAFGHFRPVQLWKQDPDGTLMLAKCRCIALPADLDIEAQTIGTYTLTFEKLEDWRSAVPGGSPIYGTGLVYGTGQKYGAGLSSQPITTQSQQWTITNHGDAIEWNVTITLYGPLKNPVLTNFSMNVDGRPYPSGSLAPNPMSFSLPIVLNSGEFLSADGRTWEVYSSQSGFVPWAIVKTAPGQSGFMAIAPQANLFQLDQSPFITGGQVTLSFFDRWR